MKYETRTEKIGEKTGSIDWNYDFDQHYWENKGGCCNPKLKDYNLSCLKRIEQGFNDLRHVEATTDSGFPKFGWKVVTDVGMWDGWPYWKPTPSVCLEGNWVSFLSISECIVED